MIEEKLPNQSKIIIQINTNFKPFLQDRADFKVSLINDFHDAVHKWIEQKLTDNDEFEGEILEMMNDDEGLPKNITEFMDLGEISIQIHQEKVEVKQKDLDDDEVNNYLHGGKTK